jgi:hypothetical protein
MTDEAQGGHEDKLPEKPGFFSIVRSTLAAAIGVQSSKNRERDFSQGSPLAFIAAGIIFTVLFIVTVVTVVHLVL